MLRKNSSTQKRFTSLVNRVADSPWMINTVTTMASVSSQNAFVIFCHLGLQAFKIREWTWKSKKVETGKVATGRKWEIGSKRRDGVEGYMCCLV